jgi:hypothetical protein
MGHLAFCLQMSVSSAPAVDVSSGLLCNLLTQPEKCVISEPQPDFGWIVNSSQAAGVQSAYQFQTSLSVRFYE